MKEDDEIKRRIRERLRAAPKFPAYCGICGKYAATFTRPVQIVHFDCWKNPKSSRRESP